MKKFNEKQREKQLSWLDKCDSYESLGRSSVYIIKVDFKVVDTCQCAGTASMLLDTKYKDINVFISWN